MPRICPYGSHIYVFGGQSLPIWDLYRSYMGKKAYMGPMQDPNGINAQILPILVPYIHVCWGIVNILKEMLKHFVSFELKLILQKMHQLHLNQTCFSITVSPDAFILKHDIWLKCYCIHNITFQINIRSYMKIFCNWKKRNS